MASFYCQFRVIARDEGRSATAAAAYRAAERIRDVRTGLEHDYRCREGVVSADIVLLDGAPEWAKRASREYLWSAAELAERRKNSIVAREVENALPSELSARDRRSLALAFAGSLRTGLG